METKYNVNLQYMCVWFVFVFVAVRDLCVRGV